MREPSDHDGFWLGLVKFYWFVVLAYPRQLIKLAFNRDGR